MRRLARAVAGLAAAGAATAQTLQDDVAVLLAFKAHGDNAQADGLDTWVSGGDPCAAGFDDPNSGFAHVMCCASYDSAYPWPCTGSNTHHVTSVDLYYTAVDGDVAALAGLTQLSFLDLYGTAVDGDVAALAGLTQLSLLSLYSTAVDGDVAALAGLTQLSFLDLSGTGCYGDSSALPGSVSLFSSYCSSSHDACPAGRTPVSSPDTYVGSNACACCSGTQKLLDSGTGACVDPGA